MDVYLQPLIKKLKELWGDRKETYVSSKKTFQIHVVLMWIINDFPVYGDFSVVKGKRCL